MQNSIVPNGFIRFLQWIVSYWTSGKHSVHMRVHTHSHTESYTHFRSYKQQSTNFQHCKCTRSEHDSCHCQSKKITYTPPVVCIGTKRSYIAKDTDTKSKVRATINLVNGTNQIHINKNDKHVYAPVTASKSQI